MSHFSGVLGNIQVFFVMEIVVGVIAIILNSLAILAMRLALSELQPRHRFLICLSVSDIAVSSVISILNTLTMFSVKNCYALIMISCFLFIASACLISSLMLLAFDLFIAITNALRYESLMRKRRVNIAIALMCLWCAIVGLSLTSCPLVEREFCEKPNEACDMFFWIFGTHCLVCGIFIFIFYSRVLWEIWHMSKMVQPSQNSQDNRSSLKKAVFTVLLVTFTFALFMTPSFFVSMTTRDPLIQHSCILWAMLNFIVDPIIYSMRMGEIRAGYKHMHKFIKCVR